MIQFHETLPTELRWRVSQRINEVCSAHWERFCLNEIARVQNGFAFQSKFFSKNGSGYPLVRIRDVGAPDTETNYSGDFDGEYIVRHGDILIGMDGEFRCRKWLGRDALLNQRVCRLIPTSNDVHFEFFFKILQPYLDAIEQVTSSLTVKHLSSRTVEDLELPLPPLAEQRRIVAKIEALQERSRRVREVLSEVGPLLEQFRQSVLAAAFRGDLTTDWRTTHPNVEPASELLQRIRVEHRRRWEQAELAKYAAKGQKPPKNWNDKYEEPTTDNDSDMPKLPAGWAWCQLNLLGEDPLNTVQTGPFGAQLHHIEFTTEGVPVIAVGNLTGIEFTKEGLYFITKEKAKQLHRYDVQAGDVLFARSGATLGKVCVAPSYVNDWRMTGHILRARLNRAFVVPEIVAFALWGDPVVKSNVMRRIRGMTRPGYNTSLLQSIPIPLPPIDEQRALLALISRAFSSVDYIADFVQVSLPPVLGQLDQAILAKAFRGELVPQDPNDELASALLARIREQKMQQTEAAKHKQKTSTTLRGNKRSEESSRLTPQQLTLPEMLLTKG